MSRGQYGRSLLAPPQCSLRDHRSARQHREKGLKGLACGVDRIAPRTRDLAGSRRANCSTSEVLPSPASPPTRAIRPSPACRSCAHCSRTSSDDRRSRRFTTSPRIGSHHA
jgi:hypothetical protein